MIALVIVYCVVGLSLMIHIKNKYPVSGLAGVLCGACWPIFLLCLMWEKIDP
jgi:hypothetical protein